MSRLNTSESIARHEHHTFYNMMNKNRQNSEDESRRRYRSRMLPYGIAINRDSDNQIEYEGIYLGDNKYRFGPIQKSFYIYHFIVRVVIPEIEVVNNVSGSEKIEIRFPSELAPNVIISAILDAGPTGKILLGDTHSINIFNHYFNERNITTEFQEYNGNLESITTFSERIPSFVLKITLPVFNYAEQPFPSFYTDKNHPINVDIAMRSNIMELIQMRITNGQKYVILPGEENNNYSNFLNIKKINELAKSSKIHTPSLYVNQVYITDEEKEFYLSKLIDARDRNQETLGYNFKYFIPLDTEDQVCQSGKSISIPIRNNSLAQCIFWMLQNKDALRCNDYSNYTDNNENKEYGRSPIDNSIIMYNKETAYGPYPADISQSVNGSTSNAYLKGYHGLGSGVKMTDTFATLHGHVYSFLDAELKIKCREYQQSEITKETPKSLEDIIKRVDTTPKHVISYRPIVYLMAAGVLKVSIDDKDDTHMVFGEPSLF